jgi:hypothetical protein
MFAYYHVAATILQQLPSFVDLKNPPFAYKLPTTFAYCL